MVVLGKTFPTTFLPKGQFATIIIHGDATEFGIKCMTHFAKRFVSPPVGNRRPVPEALIRKA